MGKVLRESFDFQDLLQFSSSVGAFVSPLDGATGKAWQSNNNVGLEFTHPTGLSEWYQGSFFKGASLLTGGNPYEQYRWLYGTDKVIALWFDDNRRINASVGNNLTVKATGSHVFADNEVPYIETYVKIVASGVIEVKVNEILDLLFDGDTRGQSQTSVTKFYWSSTRTAVAVHDSVYINDTSGSENNGYEGILHMLGGRVPTGNSAASWHDQWQKSTGSSAFVLIDEIPHNSDTDYIYSQTSGELQGVSFQAHGLPTGTVIKVRTFRYMAREVSSVQIYTGARIGGADYFSSAKDLTPGYGYVEHRMTKRPSDNADWELSDAPEYLIKMV